MLGAVRNRPSQGITSHVTGMIIVQWFRYDNSVRDECTQNG